MVALLSCGSQNGIHGLALFPAKHILSGRIGSGIPGHQAAVLLSGTGGGQGHTQRSQLGTDNGLGVVAAFTFGRVVIRILHPGKTEKHRALVVADIAIGINPQVADTRQIQLGQVAGILDDIVLIAEHIEALAVHIDVQAPARGGVGGGGHIQVD